MAGLNSSKDIQVNRTVIFYEEILSIENTNKDTSSNFHKKIT